MKYFFILFMFSQYEVDFLLQQNSKQTNFVLRIWFLVFIYQLMQQNIKNVFAGNGYSATLERL